MKKQKKQDERPAEEMIKPKKVFSLKLSKQELLHLRDLFGIVLPVDMKSTISQALAASQGRHMSESKLWNKLVSLFDEAEIPYGDEAPDFIVSISAPPQLGVFEMVSEDSEQVESIPNGLASVLSGDDE